MKGIDGGDDINRDILVGIYDRTSRTPFKPAADHVTQVMKVEQMIVGKKPVSTPQLYKSTTTACKHQLLQKS